MAKNDWKKPEVREEAKQEVKAEAKSSDMTVAEARALRAAAYKATTPALTDSEKREAFRIFWAQEKAKYGKTKDLEQILWLHLKAVSMDTAEKFEQGIKHFGLIKVR